MVQQNNKNTKAKVQEIIERNTKDKDEKKSLARTIFDIAFWVIIAVLAIVWVTDFIKVQNDKKPVFCLVEKTHKFKDGTVDECVGLGYKIYDYNRESIDAHQFGPLFIKMKK